MAGDLAGQTVVVIGGSAGIGLETARQARDAGAQVVITGRNPDRLQQAADELKAVRTAAFDAADTARLKQFFDTPLSASLLGDQLEARREELRPIRSAGSSARPMWPGSRCMSW